MKKILSAVLSIVMVMSLAGCNGRNQAVTDLTQATESSTKSTEEITESTDIKTNDVQTEEIFLPPDDIDLLAAANECLEAYHKLYLNYLEPGNHKTAFHFDCDPSNPDSKYLQVDVLSEESSFKAWFFPVKDEKIKCYDDLKGLFTPYCTEEFADYQLKQEYYQDYEGQLYWADIDNGRDCGRGVGCYINKCTVEKNKMLVDMINVGADGELISQIFSEEERTEGGWSTGLPAHDTHFQVMLVWNGEKWLIKDCGRMTHVIGKNYRSDWAMSQSGGAEVTAAVH